MPKYYYKALSSKGENLSGFVEADTQREGKAKLRVQGIYVTMIHVAEENQDKKNIFKMPQFTSRKKIAELAVFTKHLSTLLGAGITLSDALNALTNQMDNNKFSNTIKEIREKITQGSSFADALSNHPQIFDPLYYNMVKAGETSGSLDSILSRLAAYLQAKAKLRGKVTAALIYPAIMICVGFLVLSILLIYVVPNILKMLEKNHIEKPLPTQILQSTVDFLLAYWPIILILAIASFIGLRIMKSFPKGKYLFDKFKLKIPIFGELYKKQAVSNFSSTLGNLLESGIPALEAIKIVRNVVGNSVMANVLDNVIDKVLEGTDISTPLKADNIFPPVVCYMISIGEESGRLEELLKMISESYDEEIELTTQKITSLIEPIIIVVMAFLVGFVALAVLLPILSTSNIV